MKYKVFACLFWALASCLCISTPIIVAQEQRAPSGFYRNEPNLYAPGLYADMLTMNVALGDLPGLGDARSFWEVSYQLFFIPEAKFNDAVKKLPAGGNTLRPAQFPGRSLLAEGNFKRNNLSASDNRKIVHPNIPFKSKVLDRERLKFARLLTSYSVKIYDARLKKNVYYTGGFLSRPFDQSQSGDAVPRDTIYLNFALTPEGELERSQRPLR